jgi:DNA polymerase I-like protein with 3'-5' exonuclease and polymerase domains
MITAFDVETSRFPDGSPYRREASLVSWAASTGTEHHFRYFSDADFVSALQNVLNQTTLLVVINGKFDIGWAHRVGCHLPTGIRVWDCQLAEYVLSGQTNSFASMEDLCERYNIPGKGGGLEEYWGAGIETKDIPRNVVETYNLGDVSRTLQIYHAQLADPRMTEALKKLILLQGLDLLVLQQMEQNGILYDRARSITKGDEAQAEIEALAASLQEFIEFEHFNLASGDHLSCLLYGGIVGVDIYTPTELVYKSGPRKGESYIQNKFSRSESKKFPGLFKPLPRTELKKDGFYQTGEPILRQLSCRTKAQKRLIETLLRLADLQKLVGSFLHALPALAVSQGWCDATAASAMLHPTYNQCVARTGRLSCSKPNAQQWDDVTSENWISRYD